jgi:hypothetical protein
MPVTLWAAVFLGTTGAPQSILSQGIDLEQINNRSGEGGATNFITVNLAQQSFVPHLPHLDGVEVMLRPGNPGPPTRVRLDIFDGNKSMASKELTVPGDFSGVLRFEFLKGIAVNPGSTYLDQVTGAVANLLLGI